MDRFEEQARKIRESMWDLGWGPLDAIDPHDGSLQRKFDEFIASELRTAAKVGEGCVRDDKGVERKVLGTLPLTVQGDVIGDGAYCWFIIPGFKGRDDDKPARLMYRASPCLDPDAYSGTRKVHTTREAAEAAASAREGKK